MTTPSDPVRDVGRARGLGYRPALDGVRALAISLVVLTHTQFLLVPSWRWRVFGGGFLGVYVFFVLSGFLITTLLLERRGREPNPIAAFYARRALRLLPAVLVVLSAVLLYALLRHHGTADALRSFAVALTYTTNWAELHGITVSPYIVHFWSLAVEVQFYLVWPLLLLGGLRLGLSRRQLFWAVVVAALAVTVWRAVLWSSFDHAWLRIYLRTDACADSLLIGAALALFPYDRLVASLSARIASVLGIAAITVLVVAATVLKPWSEVLYLGGLLIVALSSAVLIATGLKPGSLVKALLSTAPAVALGRISYSLYLWHLPVFAVVHDHTTSWPSAARVLVAWSIAIGAATASYRFVERPALRLKRRLGRRGASRPTGAKDAHEKG